MTDTRTAIGAVDIGGTKIAIGVVSEGGLVMARREIATEPDGPFDAAMRRVVTELAGIVGSASVRLVGVGISATGPIDPVSGAFGSVPFFRHWEGGSPAEVLARACGVTAAVENDADAGALAEAVWGAGRGKRCVAFVPVGTGIGGGIVVDGRIHRGADGAHPEIGHHVVEASGPLCSCGARGCWEALAAGPAIAEWYRVNAPRGRVAPGMTARDVSDLARRGDPVARRAMEREGYYLGIGVANLINVFAPDVIALGGSVMGSYDLFAESMRHAIRTHSMLMPWNDDAIQLAQLGPDASLIGAAEVWRHRFMPRSPE